MDKLLLIKQDLHKLKCMHQIVQTMLMVFVTHVHLDLLELLMEYVNQLIPYALLGTLLELV
jgi:hypothetical protein